MFVRIVFSSLFLSSVVGAAPLAPQGMEYGLDQPPPENVVINNRILLRLNGKPISVMDVVRKMDLLFYRQYPELASSPMARYQFYASGWRTVLGSVVDDQLIMADAEEKKVEVNDGEVREELEKLFGPDVVLNVDKLGMTLDEAFALLKTELTVQRMIGIMVRSKALTEVHPQTVKKRFLELVKNNPPQNAWVYQILSIKGPGHEQVAQQAHRLISEENIPFGEVIAALGPQEGVEMGYSEVIDQKERDLSLAYRAILETLSVGAASAPLSKKEVSRLFCLKEQKKENPLLLKEKEEELRGELLQESFVRHNTAYRSKLRRYYHLTDSYLDSLVPENLQLFALK